MNRLEIQYRQMAISAQITIVILLKTNILLMNNGIIFLHILLCLVI